MRVSFAIIAFWIMGARSSGLFTGRTTRQRDRLDENYGPIKISRRFNAAAAVGCRDERGEAGRLQERR